MAVVSLLEVVVPLLLAWLLFPVVLFDFFLIISFPRGWRRRTAREPSTAAADERSRVFEREEARRGSDLNLVRRPFSRYHGNPLEQKLGNTRWRSVWPERLKK